MISVVFSELIKDMRPGKGHLHRINTRIKILIFHYGSFIRIICLCFDHDWIARGCWIWQMSLSNRSAFDSISFGTRW